MLCLVGDDQAPADLGELPGVAQHHAVGDQHDLVGGQVAQVPPAAVEPADSDLRGEPPDLALPGAQQGGRAHHEGGPRLELPPVQVQRDDLDRLTEAHVVGEAAAEPRIAHPGQPRQAALLIRPQRRQQAWRRIDRLRRGAEAGDPRGEVSQRAFGGDPDSLAVDFRLASQHRTERLGGPHPGPRRTPQPVEQRRVEDHPAAPQPDQRPFRRRERGDLVGVEQRAVERELPAEFQQSREP